MTSNVETLPTCIGFFGDKTIPPSRCDNCAFRDICVRVVAKDRLKPLVRSVLHMEAILRGAQKGR